MSRTQCSHPGCTEPHDDWPGPGLDDLLCQDHWEAYSDALWFEHLNALAELGEKLGMKVVAEC